MQPIPTGTIAVLHGRRGSSLLLVALAVALAVPSRADEVPPPADGQAILQDGGPPAVAGGDDVVGVIVEIEQPLARYTGGVAGIAATSAAAVGRRRLDPIAPQSRAYLAYLDGRFDTFERTARQRLTHVDVLYRLPVAVGGLAMRVKRSELDALKALPGVRRVYPDEPLHLDTSRSPAFIGATNLWNKVGGQKKAGAGIVVGVLDTGVWPEHPSFADPDPAGRAYPAPPVMLAGDSCQFAVGANPGAPFTCNHKLIGARRFLDGYQAQAGFLPYELTSARDDVGHGTHTASTVAGNGGVAASILGISFGKVSGIAPRAHLIAYKVCGATGESGLCMSSDTVAAVQQAILDGVDVINFSISGGERPYESAVEQAFLDAYAAGVFVAASAGNSGPGADTVAHRGPWVTTVAASTKDRSFQSSLHVMASGGAVLNLVGASIGGGIATAAPVVLAADASDEYCQAAPADGAFAGKIVVCKRGVNDRVLKSTNVAARGAVGMILYNPTANTTDTDSHAIPTVHLDDVSGASLLAFLASHAGESATFTAGVATAVPGDVMAGFSSRGGPGQVLGVSKPDVTAPGVQIVAGNSPAPLAPNGRPVGELFAAMPGTSMASPHVAGAAALLRQQHPGWTPGQIKSALMTTAKTAVVKEDGATPTTPFDDGSGRIDLARAGNPGITFDVPASVYETEVDALWNVNYPSLFLPAMPGLMTVNRTAHDVSGVASQWQIVATSPDDVLVTVPALLDVPANGDAVLPITVDARSVPLGATRHAALTLTKVGAASGLTFPITLVRGQPALEVTNNCVPATIAVGTPTTCTVTIENLSFEPVTFSLRERFPNQVKLKAATVVGATATDKRVILDGTLSARQGPQIAVVPATGADAPAFSYVDATTGSCGPLAGARDEIQYFWSNVPSFAWAGRSWTGLMMAGNGYLAVNGSGSDGLADFNQLLPDERRPNNVLAPFWTDLFPGRLGAGEMRYCWYTIGSTTWGLWDWHGVRNRANNRLNSFQVRVRFGAVEDVTFAYGSDISAGSDRLLTVGAENEYGNAGAVRYAKLPGSDAVGTLPTAGSILRVKTTAAETAGEKRTITFNLRGRKAGAWESCVAVTSDAFEGTSYACFQGVVQ